MPDDDRVMESETPVPTEMEVGDAQETAVVPTLEPGSPTNVVCLAFLDTM